MLARGIPEDGVQACTPYSASETRRDEDAGQRHPAYNSCVDGGDRSALRKEVLRMERGVGAPGSKRLTGGSLWRRMPR